MNGIKIDIYTVAVIESHQIRIQRPRRRMERFSYDVSRFAVSQNRTHLSFPPRLRRRKKEEKKKKEERPCPMSILQNTSLRS
jgi:hypothetical protein